MPGISLSFFQGSQCLKGSACLLPVVAETQKVVSLVHLPLGLQASCPDQQIGFGGRQSNNAFSRQKTRQCQKLLMQQNASALLYLPACSDFTWECRKTWERFPKRPPSSLTVGRRVALLPPLFASRMYVLRPSDQSVSENQGRGSKAAFCHKFERESTNTEDMAGIPALPIPCEPAACLKIGNSSRWERQKSVSFPIKNIN